ncbi:eukaryotic translation initiation factor 3 subunit f [Plakobranchus ocellatus]|uniref:Eukaryotic translation initiation factor 3 subunit f n=1 Tax=Plakobranchus ocellatus TaxID=259542 RepID=A0AAV3Y663_9GAST|nr:eukaryotic translation initiation factor 3 subunit f [Plakobranchus ocellatus]
MDVTLKYSKNRKKKKKELRLDASTGTSSNASTNTSSSSEAATNTASVAAGTSRTSVNASVNTSNAGVGDGLHGNSSVGTGTDPGLGMNNQSTNTPQIHLSINGRGIPIALRPPQQGQQQQQPNSGRGIPISLRPPQQGQQQQQQQQQRAGPRQLHSHQHHFHPVPPGTGAMMNSVYADPYLSCNSHNYDTQSARSAFRALQARMRARGQQVPQANQQVPNLSTMVSGMFGNIIEQVGQAFSQGSRSSANTTGSNTTSTTVTSTTTNNSSSSTSAQQGQGSTIRGGGTTGTTTTSSNSGGNPSTQPPPFNPMEMFASMFGASGARSSSSAGHLPIDLGSVIGNLMQATRGPSAPSSSSSGSGGSGNTSTSPPGGTLADMFTYFRAQGDEQDSESPNVLVSLLETVAPHMHLTDLFSLVTGNTRVIGQLRRPLRQFVAQQLANANGSVDTLVTSALDGMFPEIEHIQSLIQVRPGVNMAMSVRNCLQTHLRTIFTAIHSDSPSSDDEFGRDLYSAWMAMMADTIGLCIYCIQNGQTGFSNMVQRYMPRMTQGMNPAITIWMTTSLQDILASFHRNHPVSEAQVMAFVVRTDTTRPEEPAATAAIASEATRTPHQADRPNISRSALASSEPTPMDIGTASPSPQPPKAKAARTLPEEEEIFVDAQETFTSRPTHQPSASSRARPSTITTTSTASAETPAMGSQNQTSIKNGPGGSDNWQSVIPQEWIPVISQDVARQRDQRPQPPLSDAYLQGLPAKRRRMMTVEHAGEMGSMGRYLPSALTRAAQAARVEPISSEENLAREAADNLDLQAELEHEVAAVLETRITSDSDFSSERFPHAKEYFHKSRKH